MLKKNMEKFLKLKESDMQLSTTFISDKLNEEKAINKIREIFVELSQQSVNHSWAATGIKKFQKSETLNPEISPEFAQDELNARLEERFLSLNIQ